MAHVPSRKKGAPSKAKARKILHDKAVRGQALTDRQRRFFGAVASGARRKRGR